MTLFPHIQEIDLLAYADGVLEDDAARKAAVEHWIATDPEAAARVAAFRDQTAALQAAYNARIAAPVPDRLYAVLERARPRRHGLYAAAVASLMIAAGTAGWLAGQMEPGGTGWSAGPFLEQVQRRYAAAEPALALGTDLMRASGGLEPAAPAPRSLVAIPAPDLSRLGFALAGAEPAADGRAARLSYAAPDGRGFALFVQPQSTAREEAIRVESDGRLAVAYWLDGPLMSAIAARLPADQVRILAESVRSAMQRSPARPPVAAPETLEAAGLSLGVRPAGAGSPDPAARMPLATD